LKDNNQILFGESGLGHGLKFTLEHCPTPSKFLIETMGGGVAFLDFDRNGILDVYLVNGAEIQISEKRFNKSSPKYWNRLFQGTRSGQFIDVTEKAGVQGKGYGLGVVVGDYDNDGFPDLLVTNYGFNELYHNRGDGTFSEVSAGAGVRADGWCAGAAFVDFDRDGHLDLFVTRYLDWSFDNNPFCGRPQSREYCSPSLYKGIPNLLFHNNRNGTFTDVSKSMGIDRNDGKSLGVVVEDFDRDGWLDLYVANYGVPCFLFLNREGKRFEEAGLLAGAAVNQHGIPFAAMGVDAGDVSYDGWPEIFVTALSLEGFVFLGNRGRGLFEDTSSRNGVFKPTYLLTGWGTKLLDLDNDGDRDILAVNGHFNDNVETMPRMLGTVTYPQPLLLLGNSGSSFTDLSQHAGEIFKSKWIGRGAAFGDFNNDGLIDVVVNHLGGTPLLLENRSTARQNNWIGFDLEGKLSPKDSQGAQIRVTDGAGRSQYYRVGTSGSYLSSSDERVIVGLGPNHATEVVISWPSGQVHPVSSFAENVINTIAEK